MGNGFNRASGALRPKYPKKKPEKTSLFNTFSKGVNEVGKHEPGRIEAWVGDVVLLKRDKEVHLCEWVPDTVREEQRGKIYMRFAGVGATGRRKYLPLGTRLTIYGDDMAREFGHGIPLQWDYYLSE